MPVHRRYFSSCLPKRLYWGAHVRSMPAMKRINVAVVGSNGHQILGLLDGLKGARLVGMAEFSPTLIRQLGKRHPSVVESARRFRSLEEMLTRTDCTLVSLCAGRRDQQARQIITCLNAGRHVLAEKPLCTSLSDLKKICIAARRARRTVWAMLTMQNLPLFRSIRKRIKSGAIGEVGHVFAQKSYKFGGNRPQDRGVDGGIIQAAIHAISFVRSTTGLEFTEISARESSVGNRKKGNLQVEFAITAKLSTGALCQIITNYLNPDSAPWWGNDQLRIWGTKGMIEAVDGLTRAADYTPRGVRRQNEKVLHSNYLRDLLREIATGMPAPLTMEDSLRCTQIALEAQLSATSHGLWRILRFAA